MLRYRIAHVAGALVVVCGGLLLAPTAIAQPKQAAKLSMYDVLAMPIETKDFHQPVPLKEALQRLYEFIAQKGAEVPILVDINAFKDANPEAPNGPYEDEVQLPVVPRRMKLAQVLQLLTSQIRSNNGTFIARNGMIEITTQDRAMLPVLLEQRIFARFDKTPFNEVIRQLVEMTGAPILIDPRLQEKAKAPITAELNGNVSLDALLPIIADMAELRIVRISMSGLPRGRKAEAAAAARAVDPNLVAASARTLRRTASQPRPVEIGLAEEEPTDGCLYVTTPANAEAFENRLRAERAEKAKAMMDALGMGGLGGMGAPGAHVGGLGVGGLGGGLGNPGGLAPAGGPNSGAGGAGSLPAAPRTGTPAAGKTLSPEIVQLQAEIAALRAEVARLRQAKTDPKKDPK